MKKKRILSILLSCIMMLSLLPANITFAEEHVHSAECTHEANTDEAVSAVQEMIDALPDLNTVSSSDYDAVSRAYDAYEELTDEQKELITGADAFEPLFSWFNAQIEPVVGPTELQYIDENGDTQTVSDTYTSLDSSSFPLSLSGYIYVAGEVSITDVVSITSDAFLILATDATLNISKTVYLSNANLTITSVPGATNARVNVNTTDVGIDGATQSLNVYAGSLTVKSDITAIKVKSLTIAQNAKVCGEARDIYDTRNVEYLSAGIEAENLAVSDNGEVEGFGGDVFGQGYASSYGIHINSANSASLNVADNARLTAQGGSASSSNGYASSYGLSIDGTSSSAQIETTKPVVMKGEATVAAIFASSVGFSCEGKVVIRASTVSATGAIASSNETSGAFAQPSESMGISHIADPESGSNASITITKSTITAYGNSSSDIYSGISSSYASIKISDASSVYGSEDNDPVLVNAHYFKVGDNSKDYDCNVKLAQGSSFTKTSESESLSLWLSSTGYNKTLLEFLNDGTAYVSIADNSIVAGNTNIIRNTKIKVDAHTCSYDSEGKCDCGRECSHTNVNSASGICRTCGIQMPIKLSTKATGSSIKNVSWKTKFSDVVANLVDGENSITLFADFTNPNESFSRIEKPLKIYLANHKFLFNVNSASIYSAADIDIFSGASSEAPGNGNFRASICQTAGKVRVHKNVTFDAVSTSGGNLKSIYLYGGNAMIESGVTLNGGMHIYEDASPNVTFGNCLAPGVIFKGWNGDNYVPQLPSLTSLNYLVTDECNHKDGNGNSAYSDGACSYCRATCSYGHTYLTSNQVNCSLCGEGACNHDIANGVCRICNTTFPVQRIFYRTDLATGETVTSGTLNGMSINAILENDSNLSDVDSYQIYLYGDVAESKTVNWALPNMSLCLNDHTLIANNEISNGYLTIDSGGTIAGNVTVKSAGQGFSKGGTSTTPALTVKGKVTFEVASTNAFYDGIIIEGGIETTVTNKFLEDYLKPRTVIALKDAEGNYTNILTAQTKKINEPAKIITCPHKSSDNTSLIGDDGVCLVCGGTCPHSAIDQSTGKCLDCAYQMAVKLSAKATGASAPTVYWADNIHSFLSSMVDDGENIITLYKDFTIPAIGFDGEMKMPCSAVIYLANHKMSMIEDGYAPTLLSTSYNLEIYSGTETQTTGTGSFEGIIKSNDGLLKIHSGVTFEKNSLISDASVQLTAGTIDADVDLGNGIAVLSSSKTIVNCLADGVAVLCGSEGSEGLAPVSKNSSSITSKGTVKTVTCNHKEINGNSALNSNGVCYFCSFACSHTGGFKNPTHTCAVCGIPCPHTNTNQSTGFCSDCDTQIPIKWYVRYESLAPRPGDPNEKEKTNWISNFNPTFDEYILEQIFTLYDDVTDTETASFSKATIDLNGHSITADMSNCTNLNLYGTGTINGVFAGSNISFDNAPKTFNKKATFKTNSSSSSFVTGTIFAGGVETTASGVKLTNYLPSGTAFAKQSTPGGEYDTIVDKAVTSITEPVKVIAHPEHNQLAADGLHCVCGEEVSAYITRTVDGAEKNIYFRNFLNSSGVTGNLQNGDKVTLIKDVTLNGNWTLDKQITLNLNGHTIKYPSSVTTVTISETTGNLKLVDNSTDSAGIFKSNVNVAGVLSVESGITMDENVTVVSNGCLAVLESANPQFKDLVVDGGTCQLSSGKYISLKAIGSEQNVSHFLTDNKIYYNDTGSIADVSATSLSSVTVRSLPIQSPTASASTLTITYGQDERLTASYTDIDGNTVSSKNPPVGATFNWYKIDEDFNNISGPYTNEVSLKNFDVGNHIFYCLISALDYYEHTQKVYVTINPATLENSANPTPKTNISYTGSPLELATAGTLPTGCDAKIKYRLGLDGEWSEDIPKATDAGTYTVYWYINGGTNYSDVASESSPRSFDAEIGQKVIAVDTVTVNEKTYDGSTDATITVKFKDAQTGSQVTVDESDYSVQSNFADATAGDNKKVSYQITLQSSSNYKFSDGYSYSDTEFGKIKKASMTLTRQTGELVIYNDYEKNYSFDFSTLLPNLNADPLQSVTKEYGNIHYTILLVSDPSNTISQRSVDETSGVLSLKANSSYETEEETIASISVNVQSQNYEDFYLHTNLSSKNRPVFTGEPTVSKTEITYGDALSSITFTSNTLKGENNADISGTFSWTDATIVPNAQDAYFASWKFTPVDGNEVYREKTGTVTIKVKKAEQPNFTAPQKNDGLFYIAKEQELVTDGKAGKGEIYYKLGESGTWSTSVPKAKDADSYTVYWYIKSTDANYVDIGSESQPAGSFNVAIDKFDFGSNYDDYRIQWQYSGMKYNGTAQTPAYRLELYQRSTTNKVSLTEDVDFDASNISANINQGRYVGSFAGINNFTGTFSVFWYIKKADAPTSQPDGSITVYNNNEKAYSIDASQFLPDIGSNSFGLLSYSLADENDSIPAEATNVGISSQGILSFNFNKTTSTVGEIGSIKIKVTSTNYEDFVITAKFNAQNSIPLSGTPTLTKTSINYGESLSSIGFSTSQLTSSTEGTSVSGVFEWVDGTIKPDAQSSYEARWKFTPTNTSGKYVVKYGSSTITVNALNLADLSVVQDGSLTYNGNEQRANVSASATSTNNQPVSFTYSDSESGTFTSSVPMFKNAGEHTVYFKASAPNHNTAAGSFKVEIEKKTIAPRITAEEKTYDGSTDATVSVAFNDLAGNDSLTKGVDYAIASARFSDKNAGQSKAVNATINLADTQKANNYSLLASDVRTTANIKKAPLTISNPVISNKTYDGNRIATVTGVTFNGLVSDETLNSADITLSGIFADESVGNDKSVEVSVALNNTQTASNYYLTSATCLGNANIIALKATAPNFADNSVPYTGSPIAHEPLTLFTGVTNISYSYVGANGTVYPASSTAPVNAGEYTVIASFTMATGYEQLNPKTATLTITQATNRWETLPSIIGWTYDDESNDPSGEAKFGTMVVKYKPANADDSAYTTDVPKNAGNYTVHFSIDATDSYTGLAETTYLTIDRKQLTDEAIYGSFNTMVYNGSPITPTATVTLDGKTVSGEWSAVTNVYDTTVFTASGNYIGSSAEKETGMTPVQPVPDEEKPTTAKVRKGKTLATASITEGGFFALDGETPVVGEFKWSEPTKKIDDDSTEMLEFTPSNTNYGKYTFPVEVRTYSAPASSASKPSTPSTPSDSQQGTQAGTTKNDDGSSTTTTTDNKTGTVTETTTKTDGSTITTETKKDGTVTTTEKDKNGNTTTTVENPNGSTTVTETDKNGSEKVTETDVNGNVTVTEKDDDGNITVTKESADGGKITEEKRADGTTVKTETKENGETKSEISAPANTETEVTIPVDNAENVEKIIVTDEAGNKKEIKDFEKTDSGVKLGVSGNCSVEFVMGSQGAKKEFDDVHKVSHWARTSIDYVVEKGFMNGISEKAFAPDAPLTRGMLVTILYRVAGSPAVNSEIPFADVNSDAFYANAVIWAQQNGIVNGVDNSKFAPDDNITREQIAKIIYQFAKFKGIVPQGTWAIRLDYSDVADISDYAIEGVMYCRLNGIMQGKNNNTFAPKDTASRAEIATILQRFIEGNKN